MKIISPQLRIVFFSIFILGLVLIAYATSNGEIIFSFSDKSLSKDAPHDACNGCHLTHTSPGSQITMVNGNANLCISCHNPAGLASAKPISNAMKAVPGVSGNSHSWNVLATNAVYETILPSDTEMVLRIYNDTIVCSTCHNQHSQDFAPFLRTTKSMSSMCKDCHSPKMLVNT